MEEVRGGKQSGVSCRTLGPANNSFATRLSQLAYMLSCDRHHVIRAEPRRSDRLAGLRVKQNSIFKTRLPKSGLGSAARQIN